MSTEQKVKYSIYTTTKKICRETAVHINVDIEPDALDLIAELTWRKLTSYAEDLEAFQRHAKRSTITADDVLLLARRNNNLKQILESKLQTLTSNKPTEATGGKRKRKTTSSTS